MNRAIYALCLLAALAISVSGCGGGDDTASGDATSQTQAPSTTTTTETAGDRPKKGAWGVAFGAEGEQLGIIIYDLSGHTLYTFEKDKGSTSTCSGACAKTWPPALTEGKARAGGAALPAKVGTTKRKDGTIQLTYAGHPLYRYSRDGSGEVKGNDVESFGGEWYAIRPNGEKP